MSWSSLLLFYLLSSAITGSLMFCLWWIIIDILQKGGPKIVYLGLKLIIVTFFVPIAGIAVLMIDQGGYIRRPGRAFWGRIFVANTDLLAVKLLFAAFLVGAVVNIVRHIRRQRALKELMEGQYDEDDAVALSEFKRIKRNMGLKSKIEPMRCDLIFSPMVVGIFHKRVLLPCMNYSKKELTVIYYHELAHYKKHDLAVKAFCVLLEIFGSLNPISYRIFKETDIWSEINCDWVGMAYLEKENISRKEYYQIIYDIFDEDKFKERDMFSSQMLAKNVPALERRIDYMKKHAGDGKKRSLSAWIAYAVAVCVTMVGTVSAYAATLMMSDLNDFLYKATETEVVAAETADSEQQIIVNPDWEDNVVYMGPNTGSARGGNVLDWTVEPGVLAVSSKIYLPEGTGIFICCIGKPSDCSYKYGIRWGSTEISTACPGGNTSNTFVSPQGRYYYIMVENTGSSTLNVNITYSY